MPPNFDSRKHMTYDAARDFYVEKWGEKLGNRFVDAAIRAGIAILRRPLICVR
jgi:hypothetical protein